MVTPEPCTNSYGTKRHLSTSLSAEPRLGPYGGRGREGESLCRPMGMSVTVYDQEAIDAEKERWGSKKRVVVAELPECKLCVRAAAKLDR